MAKKFKKSASQFDRVIKLSLLFALSIVILALAYKAFSDSTEIRSHAASNCASTCSGLITNVASYNSCMTSCQSQVTNNCASTCSGLVGNPSAYNSCMVGCNPYPCGPDGSAPVGTGCCGGSASTVISGLCEPKVTSIPTPAARPSPTMQPIVTPPGTSCHGAPVVCAWNERLTCVFDATYTHTFIWTCQIMPTPTPSPAVYYYSVKISSGTCNQKCLSNQATCDSVGYDISGTNGQKMSYSNWTSCTPVKNVTCASTIKSISVPANVTCVNDKPEWIYCRCKSNTYAVTTKG
jgi:hypothetical protein